MLRVSAVSKSYPPTSPGRDRAAAPTVHALREIDLAIGEGELIAIMGPSGCGKSTLLHLMGALDTPSSGEVLIAGRSLGSMPDKRRTEIRRNDVGFVFQFFNLVPVLTVAENVALPAVVGKVPAARRRQRLDELLPVVGLAGLEDRLPNELSGGQQQRVAIARALFNQPAVLLADEPTGNLDHAAGRDVMALFAALHASGQTAVIVTHDPEVAATAQRVILLHDGRIVADVRPRGARSLLRRLTALQPV